MEDVIKDLRYQLVVLEELQKSQSLNLELQLQNDLLAKVTAKAKFAYASNNDLVRKEDAIVVSLKNTFYVQLRFLEGILELFSIFCFQLRMRLKKILC